MTHCRAKLEEFIRKSEEFKLDLPHIPEGFDAKMFDYMVDTDGNRFYLFFDYFLSFIDHKQILCIYMKLKDL